MYGSGKRGMRTTHEQRLDKALFLEGLAEQKPENSASKWFKRKAYSIKENDKCVAAVKEGCECVKWQK